MVVGAFSVLVAIVATIRAFVYIGTTRVPMARAVEAIFAWALVTSIDIFTRSEIMAIVFIFGTLIDVYATSCIGWLGC
jgi:hypothetical protein